MPTKIGNMARTLFVSLIYVAVYGGLQMAFAIIPAFYAMARSGPEAATEAVFSNLFLCTLAAMLAAAVLYIFFGLLRERPLSRDIALPSLRGFAVPVFLLAAGCRLGVCVYTALAPNIPLVTDSLNNLPDYSSAYSTPFRIVLAIASATVLGPIFEEVLFRGFIQGELMSGFSPRTAIFLSSLIFAVAHGVLFQSVFTFFVGLALGWCRYRTKGLTCSMLLHIMFNISSAAAVISLSSLPRLIFASMAAVALTVVSVIMIRQKTKS